MNFAGDHVIRVCHKHIQNRFDYVTQVEAECLQSTKTSQMSTNHLANVSYKQAQVRRSATRAQMAKQTRAEIDKSQNNRIQKD